MACIVPDKVIGHSHDVRHAAVIAPQLVHCQLAGLYQALQVVGDSAPEAVNGLRDVAHGEEARAFPHEHEAQGLPLHFIHVLHLIDKEMLP